MEPVYLAMHISIVSMFFSPPQNRPATHHLRTEGQWLTGDVSRRKLLKPWLFE